MAWTTDRRQVLGTLGGLVVAGAGALLPRLTSARPSRPDTSPGGGKTSPGADTPGRISDAKRTSPPPHPAEVEADVEAVRQLVAPLDVGSVIGGVTLVQVHGIRFGAAALSLRTRGGQKIQVDICLSHDGDRAFEPVASSGRYDLLVANGGNGSKPTDGQIHRAVRALAAAIRANEPTLPTLKVLTLAERLRRHPGGRFGSPPVGPLTR